MRLNPTPIVRCVLALLLSFLGPACFGAEQGQVAGQVTGQVTGQVAGDVRQPVAIQFTVDRPIDSSAAPFILAATRGLFGSEGMAVATDIASGSPEAIARVASGAS